MSAAVIPEKLLVCSEGDHRNIGHDIACPLPASA